MQHTYIYMYVYTCRDMYTKISGWHIYMCVCTDGIYFCYLTQEWLVCHDDKVQTKIRPGLIRSKKSGQLIPRGPRKEV